MTRFVVCIPEKAFGSRPDSLGIIVVRDLPPEYKSYRERLLLLANSFAHMDEGTREKYADAKSRYRCGGVLDYGL